MKKTSKFDRFFKFIWLGIHPKCDEWDEALNKILDMPITGINQYCVTFADRFDIWIENHPYASGYLRNIKGDEDNNLIQRKVLPSVSTRIRLEDIVNKHLDDKTNLYSKLFTDMGSIKTEL